MDLIFILLIVNLIRDSIGSYHLFPENVNFAQAVQKCSSINATVLFIDNSTEDTYIKNTYLNSVTDGIWLAIYDIFGNESNVNYYTYQTLNYTNWDYNDRNDKCFRYKKDKNWWDIGCDSSFSTLCEFSPVQTSLIVTHMTTSMTIHESRTTYKTTIIQSPTIATTQKTISVSNIMNIALWNKWNPWSFCELHRKRNYNMTNRIENEIYSVSCSLVCAYSVLNKYILIYSYFNYSYK
jgi:hypothetical protein